MNVIILLAGMVWMTACSPLKTTDATAPLTDASVSAKELSTAVAGVYVKKRVKISTPAQRASYALLFLAGDTGSTVTARPTVLMTLPYEGFDWSEDATDRAWSTNAAAGTGYLADDAYSTGYTAGRGQIQYALKSEADLYGDALFYLLHGMNVAFVFNRFYAGGTFNDHAGDTALALRYLASLPSVDADRIGVYGLSWGGMTAAYGVVRSGLPVKQLTLLSPALDLDALVTQFQTWIPNHVVSTSQLNLFSTFFAPYGRRIAPRAASSLASTASLSSQLGSKVAHTQIYADDWDTLVPTASTRAIVAAMPASRAHGLWWSHATALDFETASLGHNVHPVDSLVFSDVMTMMQLEMASALLPAAQPVTVLLYDVNQWNKYLSYMRDEQLRGQDMTAFTRMLIQMAEPRVTVQNQADTTQTAPGADWISLWLQLYWGVTIPSAQILTTLQTTGLPP